LSKRRSHGLGGFRSRGGTEYFVFRPEGAKHQKWVALGPAGSLGSRKREQRAREIRADYRVPKPGEEISYGEATERLIVYLRDTKGRSAATIELYESSLRRHFSDWSLRDITTITRSEVESRQTKLRRTLEPKSVNNYMGNSKAVFNFAVKRGWIDESPATHVDPLRVPDKGKLKFLKSADLEALCGAVPRDPLGRMEEVIYRVTFETGMRLGEVLALRWHDLDYVAEKITVERANNGRVGEQDGPTKNGKTRTISMTERLRDLFELWFRVSHYRASGDRIFAHPETGKLYDRSKLRKRYSAALLLGGVGPVEVKDGRNGTYVKPVLTFHSLRHSYGTALAMGGTKAIEIKELMGHSSLAVTERYMHFAPDVGQADRIGAIFDGLRDGL
jgi:integrase